MANSDLQQTVNEESEKHGEQLHGSADKSSNQGADKREELRRRIAAAEERNANRSVGDQAKDVADSVVEFAKEHPLTTLAGAAFVGVAIAAMTRPGRRLGRRAGGFASAASDAIMAYGLTLVDDIGDLTRGGKDTLEDWGDEIDRRGRKLRRDARYRKDAFADEAAYSRRRLGRRGDRATRGLRDRFD